MAYRYHKVYFFYINAHKKLTSVTTSSQCVTDALIYSCFSAPLSSDLYRLLVFSLRASVLTLLSSASH